MRIGDSSNQGDLQDKKVPAGILVDNQGTRMVFEGNRWYSGIQDAAWVAYWGTLA